MWLSHKPSAVFIWSVFVTAYPLIFKTMLYYSISFIWIYLISAISLYYCSCLLLTANAIHCPSFYRNQSVGVMYATTGQGRFLVGCCCSPLICGCNRVHVKKMVGIDDNGVCGECCLHFFCHPCAITQEYRAVMHFRRAHARANNTILAPDSLCM